MGIYDVPAGMLIEEAAKDFKGKIKKPAFTDYAKTGAHKERAPNNPDWFYMRMAAVLYRAYKEGNVGTGRLRTYFGGRKNRGVRPEKKMKAGGKILRVCLQTLEKEGLIKKEKNGRKITAKGEKFLFEKSRIAQKAFDEKAKRKQDTMAQDAEKRAANRAKAEQQAAQPQQQPQKGRPMQVRPAQPAGAAPSPAPPRPPAQNAEPQKPQHRPHEGTAEQPKGNDDGRGRAEE